MIAYQTKLLGRTEVAEETMSFQAEIFSRFAFTIDDKNAPTKTGSTMGWQISEFREFDIRRLRDISHCRPKSPYAIAEPSAQLRQSLGPENQQRYSDNYHQVHRLKQTFEHGTTSFCELSSGY